MARTNNVKCLSSISDISMARTNNVKCLSSMSAISMARINNVNCLSSISAISLASTNNVKKLCSITVISFYVLIFYCIVKKSTYDLHVDCFFIGLLDPCVIGKILQQNHLTL
jgi:hypothetical protein